MQKIKTYKTLKDDYDNLIPKLKYLIVPLRHINEDGTFFSYTASTGIYIDEPSIVVIIDDVTLNQLEEKNIYFNGYELVADDDEEIEIMTETEEEKKIRELREQLAALEASQEQGE